MRIQHFLDRHRIAVSDPFFFRLPFRAQRRVPALLSNARQSAY